MTLLVYDDIYLKHYCGEWHPERPERLQYAISALEKSGLMSKLHRVSPRAASKQELALVHTKSYIDEVERLSQTGHQWLDLDTCVSEHSWEAAIKAVGGVLAACDEILKGTTRTAFCAVRPPGHHATPARGMGFCIFNNVAIAARYLQSFAGLSRIAIVDWDCHHGNGTAETFYHDSSVLYISLHRYPFYPGSGSENEAGEGTATGTTLNIPLPASTPKDEYRNKYEAALRDTLIPFKPQFILISAGFDALAVDPIAGLGLSPEDFGWMTKMVCDAARETAGCRVVSALEGGYNLDALAECVCVHVAALIDGEEACA